MRIGEEVIMTVHGVDKVGIIKNVRKYGHGLRKKWNIFEVIIPNSGQSATYFWKYPNLLTGRHRCVTSQHYHIRPYRDRLW